MTLRFALPAALLLLAAAGPPPKGFSLQVTPGSNLPGSSLPVPPRPPLQPPLNAFQPAPLPNRDIDGPTASAATSGTSVAPSLFTRSDGYRGDGFAKGSTAQNEQEKRVRPGAGLSLTMPLTPN